MGVFSKLKEAKAGLTNTISEIQAAVKEGGGPHIEVDIGGRFDAIVYRSTSESPFVRVAGVSVGRKDPPIMPIDTLNVDPTGTKVTTERTLFAPTRPDQNEHPVMWYRADVPKGLTKVTLSDLVRAANRGRNQEGNPTGNPFFNKPKLLR